LVAGKMGLIGEIGKPVHLLPIVVSWLNLLTINKLKGPYFYGRYLSI
jgi:hypothetical protein